MLEAGERINPASWENISVNLPSSRAPNFRVSSLVDHEGRRCGQSGSGGD
jgi:hypothetical protein